MDLFFFQSLPVGYEGPSGTRPLSLFVSFFCCFRTVLVAQALALFIAAWVATKWNGPALTAPPPPALRRSPNYPEVIMRRGKKSMQLTGRVESVQAFIQQVFTLATSPISQTAIIFHKVSTVSPANGQFSQSSAVTSLKSVFRWRRQRLERLFWLHLHSIIGVQSYVFFGGGRVG